MAQPAVFSGEIMDSTCAARLGHGSMRGQQGSADPTECTEKCVAAGARYVLYVAATRTTYQLDDQAKAKPFAGQAVRVTGILDRTGTSIRVDKVERTP
jgi:hypothetical protein